MTKVRVYKYSDRPHYLLGWIDPRSGKRRFKSSKTSCHAKAEKLAEQLESELEDGISWVDFRREFKNRHLVFLSEKGFSCYQSALNSFERTVRVTLLKDVRREFVEAWLRLLRFDGKSDSTVRSYRLALFAAIRWAHANGMISAVPKYCGKNPARTQDTDWELSMEDD